MQLAAIDSIVKNVYLFHRDGTPLLDVPLVESERLRPETVKDMFERLFSAIDEIFTELGQHDIRSVTVNDGLLVYKVQDPFLFAAYTNKPRQEEFARYLVEQIEYEFTRIYNDIPRLGSAELYESHFNPFESRVRELYAILAKIHQDYPKLMGFLPSFVPLFRLNEVLSLGLDIIEGYPHDTIRLVRQFPPLYSDEPDLVRLISTTIGRYSGNEIAKRQFDPSIVRSQSDVLKLLNEISVAKLADSKDEIEIVLCPVCRDRVSESPICWFFSGFIEGVIDNPSITVEEVDCKATGAESCRFKLNMI